MKQIVLFVSVAVALAVAVTLIFYPNYFKKISVSDGCLSTPQAIPKGDWVYIDVGAGSYHPGVKNVYLSTGLYDKEGKYLGSIYQDPEAIAKARAKVSSTPNGRFLTIGDIYGSAENYISTFKKVPPARFHESIA